MRTFFAFVAAAALLAIPVASASHPSPSAQGNVRWTIELPNAFGVEVGNRLSFNVRSNKDGTVEGGFKYDQTVEGETFRFKVSVTCMKLYEGNRAKIGGVIERSNDDTQPPGRFAWFQVFDNGSSAPDRSSLVGFGDEAANEAFCDSPNLPRFGPWDVEGEIEIRG